MHEYAREQNITVAGALIYAFIAVCVYFILPRVLLNIFGKAKVERRGLLGLSAMLFFVSLLLPSPLIHGQNTNFTTHFAGGGIFTGFIWLYIKDYIGWKVVWPLEVMTLYFLVCGLGVANELFEFFANSIGLFNIPGTDTWWDLFANTLGALTFWFMYRIVQRISHL